MKRILTSTTIAMGLTLGGYGLAGAQGVSPSQPGSAAGGQQAQATQPGGMSSGATTGGATMGQTGTTAPSTGQPGGSMAGQRTGQQASRMSEDQLRNTLKARGYSDVSSIERDGNTFKVKEAKRYGEEVENLRIDASTGQVRDEKRLSEDQVKNLLRERGYSDVSDVKRDGNTVSAKAKQNDREIRVRVDAQTGIVTQQQASN